MPTPLASICVPTLNGAPWLAACLQSACDQTISDIEILVVDDASEDDSVAIAREFAARDDRVVVVQNQTRLGLAPNWNRCVELAKGDWTKFLFQDDDLVPTCLECMIDASRPDVPFVLGGRRLKFSPATSAEIRTYFAGLPRHSDLFGDDDRVSAGSVCRALVAHPGVNFFGEPSAVLLHRDAFARFGRFNTEMIQLCDLEFAARIGSNTGFVRVSDEIATFHIHERSASAANNALQHFRKDVLDTLILLHEFAFAEHFAALRRVAREVRPSLSFAALAARELSRAQRDARSSDDPGLPQALAHTLASHPKLARPLWRLWHRVRKHMRS